MSDKVFCDFCGEEIPASVLAKRHRPIDVTKPHCCNREHDTARRKRDNFYKQMSQAGFSARSKAVAQSNREKPRRKKKNSSISA